MAKAADKLAAVTSVREPLDVNFDHVDLKLWTYNFQGQDVYPWDFDTQMSDLRVDLNITQASTVEIDLEDDDYTILEDPLFAQWAWDIEDVSLSSQKKFKTTRLANSTNTAYLGDSQDLEWVIGQKPIDFKLNDEILFRLCGLQAQQTALTLTLEDRVSSYLRDHKGALSWDRSQHTRAQFVAMLCKQAGVDYFIPELNTKQPVEVDTTPSSNPLNNIVNPNGKGIANTSGLMLQGLPLTPTQVAIATTLLGECDRLQAPLVCWQAILYAATAETGMGTNPITFGNNSAGATGVLQGTDPYWDSHAHDVAGQADSFLQGGKGFQGGGAIHLANSGTVDPEKIAVTVEQGGQYPLRFATVSSEIDKIIAAYGGPKHTGSGGGTTTGSYAFTRGANENSWDCIQRLASEVAWYAFVRQNRLWFVSGNYLFSQESQLTVERGKNGVDFIDPDIDMGERDSIAQCMIYCRTSLWTALPGMVVTVIRRGPASGKWIVASVENHPRDASQQCIVTLQKPIPKRPEPISGTSSTSTNSATPSNGKVTSPAPGSTPGRLDMGQDGNYDMVKGAVAPYNGTVYVPGIGGWPGHGTYFYVVNDDQSGPDYTRAMYFAEGATPAVRNAQKVTKGQQIGFAVSYGGNGTPGNFEIGPANTTNGDCLAKKYGLGSTGAANMVKSFSKWIQSGGMPAPNDTSNAGAP